MDNERVTASIGLFMSLGLFVQNSSGVANRPQGRIIVNQEPCHPLNDVFKQIETCSFCGCGRLSR
jgi:hypothetical protein